MNRTPTKQAPGATPYEVWTGKKPYLGHCKIFGCEAYVHIPKQKRYKLQPKSKKLMFVGYEGNSTNYRLFDTDTKQVTVSRNVIFHEKSTDIAHNVNKKTKIVIEENSDEEERVEEDVQDKEEKKARPQRETRVPSRFEDYELNYVEIDVPETYQEALASENKNSWKKAIDEELEALEKNNTWEYAILPEGKKPITSKWVFKIKRDTDGNVVRYKARLCAKGCQQKAGLDYSDIFSPTTRYDTIRILLAVVAQNDFEFMQFDIKTAFLYGDIDNDIYMTIPEGVKINNESNNTVCKLKKSLYGLKQAPRLWNKKFNHFIQNFGLIQSKIDNCVYYGNLNNTKVILVIYVDDGLIISENMETIECVLDELRRNFEITVQTPNYFVGLEIVRDRNEHSVFIHQTNYVKQIIKRFGFDDANPIGIPADPHTNLSSSVDNTLGEDEVPYRQAVGSLLFAAIVSRPDISYAVGAVSRYLSNHTQTHWNAVKRIFQYLKDTPNLGIKYRKTESLQLIGYSDANFASDVTTRKSITGCALKLCNGPVVWTSQKQNSVSLSTTEAEYIAASQTVKEILWARQLLEDVCETINKPVKLYVDNQSAIRLIRNPEFHKRTKHVDVRYHFVREKVSDGVIEPVYIQSADQLADIFTKALPKQAFSKLRSALGIQTLF